MCDFLKPWNVSTLSIVPPPVRCNENIKRTSINFFQFCYAPTYAIWVLVTTGLFKILNHFWWLQNEWTPGRKSHKQNSAIKIKLWLFKGTWNRNSSIYFEFIYRIHISKCRNNDRSLYWKRSKQLYHKEELLHLWQALLWRCVISIKIVFHTSAC